MQRTGNPYLSFLNHESNEEKTPSIKENTPMSIWSRNTPPAPVSVPARPVSVSVNQLQVGDVIEMPIVQRLRITQISDAAEGAIVVGVPMVVIHSNGHEGVFADQAAAPIVVAHGQKINCVFRAEKAVAPPPPRVSVPTKEEENKAFTPFPV